MREKFYFLAGMFVMMGLLIILFILFTFSRELTVFNPSSSIYCRFNNIAGLRPGALVFLSGYQIGNVRTIDFQDAGKIIVELDILDKYMGFIDEDSIASINSTGLLGDKAIYIRTGNSQVKLESGMMMLTKEPFEVDSALEGMESLAKIFHRIEAGHGNIGILINDDELYNTLLEGAKNFKEISERFNRTGAGVLLPRIF